MRDGATEHGIFKYCLDVRNARTFQALRHVCVGFLRGHKVKMMSYHHLPPVGAADYTPTITIATYGFPKAWVERYIKRRYFEIDPIPRHALSTTTPFWWSEARKFPNLRQEEKAYIRDLTKAHLGNGLAVPVFGPRGRNGYCGIGFGKPRRETGIGDADAAMLQWACQVGHLQYCDLLRQQTAEPLVLSPREREILEWVARGKSNAVIGELLGISTYTVDTYLRRIYVKLGVSDRVTAALRGLAVGAVR